MPVLIAVDAGTTGVRAFAVDAEGRPRGFSYRELTQHFPRPGWVEHDPDEIWAAVQTTLADLAGLLEAEGVTVAAIGITNQRETVVAWDRRTGRGPDGAGVGHRRRPAGRTLRPCLLHAGDDQEHLRNRLLRPHERGAEGAAAGRGPAHHRGLDAGRRDDGLRPRGRRLRDGSGH